MGSAAACHLARRGRRVLGLERFTAAHDRGSSHGESRIIRLTYFEGAGYVPLLRRAYELWRALERDAGEQLLWPTGGLWLGPPGSELLARTQATAEQCDLDYELLDGAALRRRFPTFAAADGTVGFFDPAGGLVRPEATVAAHLRLAAAAGAELRFGEPVDAWAADPSGDGVTVRTGRGTFTGGRLVLCPGAWAADVLGGMPCPVTAQRQVQTWFDPPGGLAPFQPDRHPVWVWDPGGSEHPETFDGFVYGMPAIAGPAGGVKIGVLRGPETTADTVERTVSAPELDDIAAAVRRCLTVDPGPVRRVDVCLFENTPDNEFVIGAHPEHPPVTVAAGFSGHGFKFVPVIGEIVADLVCDGKTAHPLALFEPGRFAGRRPG